MIISCNHTSAKICPSCELKNHKQAELDMLYAKVDQYEKLLFKMGAMEEPPCFACGYSGPGYYNPVTHPCAEKHHSLRHEEK